MKSRLLTILFALALLVFAGTAAATSFVMVSDETLVDQATLIVDARVLSTDSAPRDGLPSTDYMIEVDRALAGRLSGRNLIVRVPGGIGNDGLGLALYGMPEFGVGERVLLFLKARPDGTYGVLHLMMGAFHERVIDGRALLLRDLSGARELAMPGEAPGSREEYRQPRAAEPFRRWIEDRARGRERAPDYRVTDGGGEAGGLSSVSGDYKLFSSRFGNLRWYAFDEGRDVDWFIQAGGQPGYGESRTAAQAAAAMATWNAVSQTNIRYRYAGTTTNTTGFDGCGSSSCADGTNAIIFADADGSHETPFSCIGGQGGVLAIGGPWFNSRIAEDGPNGLRFHRIPEAEIVTNQGIECFLTSDADILQLFTHELGHSLGVDHTCDPDSETCTQLQSEALMYPFFHNDERGAALNSDDRSAVRFLYPGTTGAAPAAPSGLSATVLSATEVELAWNDNSNDETAFLVQGRPAGAGNFATMGTASANQETFVVDGLDPATAYDFRVQARNGALGSGFSNTVSVTTLPDVPATPANLVAAATADETIFLQWDDLANNEDAYVVEMRTPTTADWEVVEDAIAADSTSFFVGGLTTGQPYTFRVLAVNGKGSSPPSEEVAATPRPGGASDCVADDETLCLLGDRFQVNVHWRNQFAVDDFGTGSAEMFDGSDRTGRFTFFNPNNVELIVKVLNGVALTDHYWTFYGALSNVEYWITVVDTDTGTSQTYYNPPGGDCGQFDTQSIPAESEAAGLQARPLTVGGPYATSVATAPLDVVTAAAGTCEADAETLCLFDDRFSVTVDWTNQHAGGEQGVGTAIPDTNGDRTGYFWFFNPANVELVTKVLYAPSSDTYWFFYGSLSDVQYTITVTDTESGQSKTYTNPPGGTCGEFDTAAFPPLDEELPEDPIE